MPLVINTPFKSVSYQDLILSTPGVSVEGYWSGDAEAGLTMTDLSGNSRDLTRPVDTSSTTGQVNEAILWSSGAVGNYADSGTVSFAGGTFQSVGWSMEAWVNPTVFSVGIYFPMIKVFNSGGVENISLNIAQPNFLSSDPFRIQLSNQGVVAASGNVGSLTGWQHIACSWNQSTTTGKVYLNGVEVFSTGVSDAGATTFDTIRMGSDPASSGYKGGIDEAVLYSGIVAEADFLAHYNAGLAA